MTDAYPPIGLLLGKIDFRGGLPAWVAYLLMALAVIAIAAVYLRESMKMHPIQRIAMAAFRAAALIAIIFLLRKPVVVSDEKTDKKLPIAILVDNSQSMNQRDPRITVEDKARFGIAYNVLAPDHGLTLNEDEAKQVNGMLLPITESEIEKRKAVPSRFEIAKHVMNNPRLNLREKLGQKGPIQEYFFGLQEHGAPKDWEKVRLACNSIRSAISSSETPTIYRPRS
ncbi:MAG: hypothetical protein K8T89_00275 [Planctomycetes bacterium]|nr:hypothetical protein [Planctomycetota bacterium]